MGFTQFQTVACTYGTGFIKEVRGDCYVVLLTNWALAQGQSPTMYMQESALTAIPGAFPGTTVKTPYGVARVISIRADGTHIVKPINWKLANSSVATLYLQPSQVSLTQASGLHQGDEVMTVYGRGFIEQKRLSDFIVKLHHWRLAQGQSPTCHVQEEMMVKIHKVPLHGVVKTCWGLVRVEDIRRDGTHVCRAVHWNLADGQAPRLYLAPEAFALMSIKP